MGYPSALFRRIGHPVTWIGSLISLADSRLNHESASLLHRKIAGAVFFCALIVITAAWAYLLSRFFRSWPFGWVLEGIVASSLIAGRSLYEHARDVAVKLGGHGLDAARQSVSRIVGRDPDMLDKHGIARAAIESLAENASDGVLAPVLWFALLGLPGLAAYKAINTADSMIGHRTPRHKAFGWAAARLDDAVNLPASRLTALFFIAAALFLPNASARNALRAVLCDAGRHRSPNAGWPESAMAGALGLRLAGPRIYGGVLVDDAFMGNGRAEAEASDILIALRLASLAWVLMVAAICVGAAITVQG